MLLAAGHSVQLVDSGNPDIAVVVSAPEDRALNLGQVIAQGGHVGIYGGLVSQTGIVSADSASVGDAGTIVFKASGDITLGAASTTSANGTIGGQVVIESAGTTTVSGTVTATGSEGKGGDIQVLGNKIELTGNALVDASGETGGGTVLVGGDSQGKNPAVQNAATTDVGENVSVKADALASGDGGKVVIWADDATTFYGAISARGGAASGDGGSAEVSGKESLLYEGTTNLSAPKGTTGSLLLDPTNFTIGTDMTGAALGTALNLANITIQTGASGSQAGDITVNDNVAWSSANTLTLNAYNNINVNDALTNNGGGSLMLRADMNGLGAGTVTFAGSGHVTLTGGGSASIFYNPPGGYTAPTNYAGYFTGVVPTAYMLVNNVNQLQNINSNLTGTYALGRDIDASATSGWNGGNGFVPIGNDTSYPDNLFSGTFNGNYYTISNLYINRPSTDYVGLFGGTTCVGCGVGSATAVIENVGLVNENVTGGFQTGGLVGHNTGTIENSFTTGSVTGIEAGGLVGLNGTIINCYSLATANGSAYAGGLAAVNYGGHITSSYSAGQVTGSGTLGGLTGYNSGTVSSNSYWDKGASGQQTSFGGTGLTTAQMTHAANFAGWDFTNTWGIAEGSSYPFLKVPTGPSGTTYTPGGSPSSTIDVGPAGILGVQLATNSTVSAEQTVLQTVLAEDILSEGGVGLQGVGIAQGQGLTNEAVADAADESAGNEQQGDQSANGTAQAQLSPQELVTGVLNGTIPLDSLNHDQLMGIFVDQDASRTLSSADKSNPNVSALYSALDDAYDDDVALGEQIQTSSPQELVTGVLNGTIPLDSLNHDQLMGIFVDQDASRTLSSADKSNPNVSALYSALDDAYDDDVALGEQIQTSSPQELVTGVLNGTIPLDSLNHDQLMGIFVDQDASRTLSSADKSNPNVSALYSALDDAYDDDVALGEQIQTSSPQELVTGVLNGTIPLDSLNHDQLMGIFVDQDASRTLSSADKSNPNVSALYSALDDAYDDDVALGEQIQTSSPQELVTGVLNGTIPLDSLNHDQLMGIFVDQDASRTLSSADKSNPNVSALYSALDDAYDDDVALGEQQGEQNASGTVGENASENPAEVTEQQQQNQETAAATSVNQIAPTDLVAGVLNGTIPLDSLSQDQLASIDQNGISNDAMWSGYSANNPNAWPLIVAASKANAAVSAANGSSGNEEGEQTATETTASENTSESNADQQVTAQQPSDSQSAPTVSTGTDNSAVSTDNSAGGSAQPADAAPASPAPLQGGTDSTGGSQPSDSGGGGGAVDDSDL